MESKLLFIVLIIFLIVAIVHRRKEYFYQSSRCENCGNLPIESPVDSLDCCNNFTIVSLNDYNVNDVFGPKCLNTCLVEHIAKVNFQDALNQNPVETDVLKYSRENQNDGFCHSFNEKENAINKCVGDDCVTNCNNASNCEIRNDVCIEKSTNYLSGGSILNNTKCSFISGNQQGCVNKYMSSIQTLKDIYDQEVQNQESQICDS